MKTTYALLLGLFLAASLGAQCLEQLNTPEEASWSAGHFFSQNQGWVIGSSGAIYQTTNAGQSWLETDLRSESDINGLTFLGQISGWVVGDKGVIRRTSNGGVSWQQQYSPIGADLNSVAFIFSNLGVIAGDCGTLLRTLDGGQTWEWVDANTPNNLNVVRWVNTQTVLVAGEGGMLLRSTNGGLNWQVISGTGTGDHYALEVEGQMAWVSGAGGTYVSEDGGLSWTLADNRSFYDLDTDGSGVVVGAGLNGLVSVSEDNGQTWRDLDLSEDADWNAIALTGGQSGYLAGADGALAAFRWINATANGPEEICAGEMVAFNAAPVSGSPNYIWNGPNGTLGFGAAISFTPAMSGWYTLVVEEEGCTASDSVLLQVFSSPSVDLGGDIVRCEGETIELFGPAGDFDYSWSTGDTIPNLEVVNSGEYGLTVVNAFGCEASDEVSIDIEENGAFQLDTLLCSGEFLIVNGNFYDEFNPIGTEVLPGMAENGCDSLIQVQIEFSVTEPVTLDTAVCTASFPFVYEGILVEGEGDYFTQVLNADGCPQMIFLSVEALQEYDLFVQDAFCEGGFYVWNGAILTNPGTYMETFSATDGCDSLVTLELSELPAPETDLDLSICEGETITIGDFVFDSDGSYEVQLTGAGGCDSIVNLQLTVIPDDIITETAGICDGDTYTWEGINLSDPGQYQLVLTNTAGCDSIRQLDLTVFSNPELFIVDTLPDNGTGNGAIVLDVMQGQGPFTVNWDNGSTGLVLTGLTAGNYTATVTDANGCTNMLVVMVSMVTNTLEVFEEEVAIWPNPTTGFLQVELPDVWSPEETTLVLYDLLGHQLLSWKGRATMEPLQLEVPNGVYGLSISYKGQRQLHKVVVANE